MDARELGRVIRYLRARRRAEGSRYAEPGRPGAHRVARALPDVPHAHDTPDGEDAMSLDLTTLVRVTITGMDGERHDLSDDMRIFILTSLEDDARPVPVSMIGAVRALLRREAYWIAYATTVEEEVEGTEDCRPAEQLQGMQYVPCPPAGLFLVHRPRGLMAA